MKTVLSLTTALAAAALISTSAMADNHGHGSEAHEGPANIIETARAAGNFNTLLAAVEAAGLTDALSGDGPFTVFAPTDEAFAQIPADQLQGLLEDTETLTAILTYHVVSGAVTSAEVVLIDSATTLQGSDVTITVTDDGVQVDEANVIAVDIEASNGIIHVIDAVITP
ncbi:MAG: fasciclin domain-containing protein [Wenzhouxiangella sp.]